jgi:hypothetical protein
LRTDEKDVLAKQASLFFTKGSLKHAAFRNTVEKDSWQEGLGGKREGGSVFDVHSSASLVRNPKDGPIQATARSLTSVSERR